jgi:hypothetical protein
LALVPRTESNYLIFMIPADADGIVSDSTDITMLIASSLTRQPRKSFMPIQHSSRCLNILDMRHMDIRYSLKDSTV